MKVRHIPNLVTILRIFLVAPILWLILQERHGEALLLFIIAGVSDGLDGFLAKNFGWVSQLGGMLDPLADKLLLVGTTLLLGWQGDLPFWLVVLIVSRDIVIVIGALSYHFLIKPFNAEPLLISKLNTLVQLTLILTVLFSEGVVPLPEVFMVLLIYTAALTTVLSGASYVWGWGRRALHKGEQSDVQ